MRDRRLWIVWLILLVNLIGFGIIIPFLPFYATALCASPVVVGWLFASYSIAQMVASPFLGDLADRYGRRPILILSLLSTVAGFVILAVARSLWILFLARIVDGLGGANIPVVRAYIGDITPPERRAQAYGLIGVAFGLGFILGPALAGILSRLGTAAPAWGAAAISAVALIWTVFWLPETVHRTTAFRRVPLQAMLHMFRRAPHVAILLLIDFLYWNASAAYQTTFALFGQMRFHLTIEHVGYLMAFYGLLGAFIQGFLVAPVVRRWGERHVMIGGFTLLGIALALAGWAPRFWIFLLFLIPASLGAGLGLPAMIALISHTGDRDEQGLLQGTTGSVESLGRMLGPIWGNGLLQWGGTFAPFVSAGGMLILAGMLGVRYTPRPAGAP